MAAKKNTLSTEFMEYGSAASLQVNGTSGQWQQIIQSICKIKQLNLAKVPPHSFSVGPENEWREVTTALGKMSIQWIDDNTYRISSGTKEIIRLMARHLDAKRRVRNQKEFSPYTYGDIVGIVFFGFVSLILLTTFLGAIDDLSIDLKEEARVIEAPVVKALTSRGKNLRNRSSRFLDFKLEGLPHQFRFSPKENYDLLVKEIVPGERIKLYYSIYGYDIYQIEKKGKVLYPKSNNENSNMVTVIMSFIFLMLSGGAIWFFVNNSKKRR